uniref:Serine/threonine-protein phosphatase n=1 Tax=Steinernema glaseri TaxID=37863 RepID=A0A1I7YR09_9BILA
MAAEAETGWLDSVIEKLGSLYNRTDINICNVLTLDEIIAILTFSTKIIMQEGSLVEVEVPIKVIGDIHGQYQDMHKLFDLIGRVPKERMIFLGDYVDRGPQSLEVIVYLLALKLRYRDRIYLLRGNHETPAVNRIYGFYEECVRKYGVGLWWEFQTVFNRMPMAGLISKKVLCMHGGLSPELTNLDQIRQIVRPCEPQDRGLLIDLLWSDPTNKGDGWFYSPRGISYAFGKGVMQAACKLLGIDMVIRAHQVVQDGYEVMVGRQLITIFSAPNYCGQFNNAAAVVCIDADLQVTFQQLRTNAPPNCNRPAPPVACELPYKPNSPPPTMRIGGDAKDSPSSGNESEGKAGEEAKKAGDEAKKSGEETKKSGEDAKKDENGNKAPAPTA